MEFQSESDPQALAEFHVGVWRQTYRDMAPPAAFAALDVARRVPQWRAVLADVAQDVAVLRDGAGLAGLVHCRPLADPLQGEIAHLYIRPALQGQGLGARLLNHGFDLLRARGARGAVLAVVAENHAARGFYRRMGGQEGVAFTDPGPLWRSDNLWVSWDLI